MSTPHAAAAPSARPYTSSATQGPILVASDGTPAAEPALLAARLLAARLGVPARVVSVVAPQPFIVPTPEGLALPGEPVGDIVARRRDRLRDEMQRLLGAGIDWAMDVRVGIPAAEVADAVEASHAQLVVTGLVHHGRFDRMLRGETPIGILHEARVPTLAVPPGQQQLPRCVLVGVDLTDASVQAARYARPLVADADTVYLVHVQTRLDIGPPMAAGSWDVAYQEAVQRAFARVREALQLPPTVAVETKVLTGSVAHELLDFAEFAKVDMVVTGHRRRPLVERLIDGGVASRLFRGASTWILMVPERDLPLPRASSVAPTETDDVNLWLGDRTVWPAFLAEFTRRNAGRRTSMEIHNYQLGAQTTVTGFPFIGIDYDRHGGRVDVMLGDREGTDRHLTHSVQRVQAIQVYRTPDGRDGALRLTDRFGHTVLTITG